MATNDAISVQIDLGRIRRNVEQIAQRTGVPMLAVVKTDAYGLGVRQVAPTIADLVAGFCFFSLAEAAAADLWRLTGKPGLTIGPPTTLDPADYRALHVRPAVSTAEQATVLRDVAPVLCVDAGMQRFACPPEQVDEVLRAGGCVEAFTHATTVAHARRLVQLCGGRGLRLHAAASSLLDEPEARLDAVRPGLALYRGAVRVSTRLVEARRSTGPIGYSGFVCEHHGVILAGYAHGLRAGASCLVNGRVCRIREVGMQSSFIELAPSDRAGDEVVLLGDTLTEDPIAAAWSTTPHEVLLRLANSGRRQIRS